jgi:hypothetical protein
VSSDYPTCPKCGALPMKSIGLWTGEEEISRGHYMCDSLLADKSGAVIERSMCFQRQRNQVVDALRWALDQIDDDLDLDHRAALESARATLNRVTGGAK